MPKIELSAEDITLLHELLAGELGDLRAEISNTDSSVYKGQLHEREDTLRRLIAVLEKASG